MSRIYEALEREEKRKNQTEPPFPITEKTSTRGIDKVQKTRLPACVNPEPEVDEEFINLYYTVDSLLGRKTGKVLQFIGSSEGDGTSTVVERFGRVSTSELGKSVLLLKADRNGHQESISAGDESASKALELLGNGASVEEVFSKNGEPCFFVISLTNQTSKQMVRLPKRFEGVLEKLRDRFDLILVDMPAPSSSVLGISLCAVSDGVILVVEAEKTARNAAQKAKERVQRAGGNILGVVLNKHRPHIPSLLQA